MSCTRAGLCSLLSFVALLSGCQKERESQQAKTLTKTQSQATPVKSAASTQTQAAPIARPPPCRALRVTGQVKTTDGVELTAMAALDGIAWLELSPTAELTLRHAVSARELVLRGPGRILPCRGGREHVLVEHGTVASAPGTGVRPGAEVWVGTPFGTARYGDANLEMTVEQTLWIISVRSGVVWTEPALQVNGRPADGRVIAGERATTKLAPSPDAHTLACEKAAKEARAGADAVVSGGAKGLGERAAAQVLLRKRARAACSSAASAAIRVTNPDHRARLVDQIARSDALWEGPPAGVAPGGAL